jgi:hypothetical protein
VRSLVSRARSMALFCRLRPRPKKEAMLRGTARECKLDAEGGRSEGL